MKHIARSNLDGTNEEIILQNVSYSMAIAVDSYAGNIYFTDRDKKTVEVAKLDGKYRKVLIQSQMHNLVGLAIDIQRGWVHQELYVKLLHKKVLCIQRTEWKDPSIDKLSCGCCWYYFAPLILHRHRDVNFF